MAILGGRLWNVLKIRNFSLFLAAQTVSQFGDKLDYIALIALVGLFPKDQAPFLLSQMLIFITLPALVFGPIAGVLVDRWHKKRVMVISDGLRMLCALAIPVVFVLTRRIYLVFTVVFAMFLLALFFNTARSAILPNMVSRKRILAANSLMNLIGRSATFAGMLLGGIIIDLPIWQPVFGVPGWTAAFVIDALTFAASALMISLMKVRGRADQPPVEEHLAPRGFIQLVSRGLRRALCDLRDAIRGVIRQRDLAFAITSIFLLTIAGSVIYVLVVPTIQHEMNWGTSGVGKTAAIGAVGILLGSYLLGVFGHRYNIRALMIGCFVVGGGIIIFFPFITSFWTFVLLCFIGGALSAPVFIGQDTLIHQHADEVIRGKVFSLREWILNGSFMIGGLIVGALSKLLPKAHLFVVFGALLIVLSLTVWLRWGRSEPAVPEIQRPGS